MTTQNLLAKYDVPGPRYTSYPTVPYWQVSPTPEQWLQHVADALQRGRAADEGASLYVHIPYCKSLCHYCGCNNFITRDHARGVPYVKSILREWALYHQAVGKMRLDEVHLGGGTPTWLSADELQMMMEGIFEHAEVPDFSQRSFEADPRTTQPEQIKRLRRLGFRRLSLGVQDFSPEVQAAVNRDQSVEQVRVVTELARAEGYESVNYDLIYGLPKQTLSSVQHTIDKVLQLRPDRIAFYGYAHIPWMKSFQRKFQDSDVPAGPVKRQLYEEGRRLLEAAGYLEIGMDHFALPTDGLFTASSAGKMHRNFMGYTERRTMPMIGLGVSSIGDSWTAFAQNEKTVEAWQAKVDAGQLPIIKGHLLDAEDMALRTHILAVMTRFETDWRDEVGKVDYLATVPDRLREMASDGLVELSDAAVKVTPRGRAFVRNVCMALDARLARAAPDKPVFSRTI